ncbi:type II toxin-antitoxin system Phd/YefM family antitoxin [Pendulispora albinea]|uniref:Antitoxin n=1 Tax=Pendulispora albinea TaxID=2741071 RepID=A0ABZ2LNN4_9BACT
MKANKKSVNVHEAKTHFSKLLEIAHAGAEIIIAKAGKPYAKLVPLERASKRPLGFVQATVAPEVFEPLAEDELLDWEEGSLVPKASGKKRRPR